MSERLRWAARWESGLAVVVVVVIIAVVGVSVSS